MNIRKSVLQTIIQSIVYVIVMRVILAPLEEYFKLDSTFDQIFIAIIFPILAGITLCFLVNKSNIKFSIKNIFSKSSVRDLLARLCIILLILLIGAILEKTTNYGNRLSHLFNSEYGINTIYYLFSFNIYVYTSIFTFTYAVFYFLFIEK